MKTSLSSKARLVTGACACRFVGILLLAFAPVLHADDTNSTPMTQQDYFEDGPNTYTDWIELSGGDFWTRGDQAQAQQIQHWSGGGFGGIEDLHIQGSVFTNVTLTLDGHSIYDQHDYDLSVRLERQDKWHLKFHFDNFRTWSDDIGGYYPPTGTQYSGSANALALDRGEFSIEGGLTLDKLPSLNFKYTHTRRDGDKSSTIWGPVHPDPLNSATVRGIYPSVDGIDETVDAFDLNAKQFIKGTTFGVGLHYEHGNLNDSLDSTHYPGEPIQTDITDREKNSYDLFSVNATSETWIKDKLMFSAGGMFANLDNHFSGDRIYGSDFDVGYSPALFNGLGYYNMTGSSHMKEYVMDLNLLAIPTKTFTIIPSVRVQKESLGADSSGTGTFSDGTFFGDATGPFNSQSSRDVIDVCENLDMRYTGVTNWVFSASGQWDEGNGSLYEIGGIGPTNGFDPFGVPPVNNETDDRRLFQKYSLGARWYPLRRLIIDAGGYFKDNRYNYNFPVDSTPNNAGIGANLYPGFLAVQRFQTYDGNLRLTLRPISTVSLVSRYEYQLSTINTAPDPASGMPDVESSTMTSHILAQDVSWVPWSRLSLQAGFNYVLSETKTPASEYTQAILNAQNNYWTMNLSSSFVVDDKTVLNLNYFYYQADDYQDNSSAGLPLGADAREHGVTATLTRQINPQLRFNLKYGYYKYKDAANAGNSNFEAQLLFASVQYRF